jgi:type IV pilus assembly protein PilB
MPVQPPTSGISVINQDQKKDGDFVGSDSTDGMSKPSQNLQVPQNDPVSAANTTNPVAPMAQEPSDDAIRSSTVTNLNGNSARTLADVLRDNGVLDEQNAQQVKLTEIQTGKPQEEIIKTKNLVNESDLTKAKAQLYNIPYIDLNTAPVSPEALSTLPQEVAERFKAFPVSIDPNTKTMVVAMSDPLDLTAIEFIEQKTGYLIKPHAADPSRVETLVTTGYSTSLAKEVSEALKEVSPGDKVKTLDASKTGLIREEKVAEIVSHILSFAIKARASDVHIEPQEHATRVRYRIDGILQEKLTIPKELHDALVSRIKILSNMKIDEKRVPQDGRFNFRSDEQEVDLRVSTLPTTWGEKIVMRLLKKSGGVPDLPDLGLRGAALKQLQEAILRPHGIILITGPTGSGKTTTLYSIIQRINTPKVNIMTLEDPIEYKIAGVNQVQVNTAAGLTFASGLRSFLRQDPNIILVGEIRDQETADLAIQASLTGHLVFSTLHTNDAAGALPRLLDMGAEPYLLASSITAIVAQRVVRKIHEDCKTAYTPDPKVVEEIKKVLGPLWRPEKIQGNQGIQLYKGQGDKACNNSGYFGRIGIFEVLPVTEKIGRLILENAVAGEIEKVAISQGMITLKQDGYMKVVDGITTIEEVLRVAQE